MRGASYEPPYLEPIAKIQCNNSLCFGCVSLDSKIYLIGGEVEDTNNPGVSIPSKDVYIFDMKSGSTEWKKGPSMRSGKSLPKVVALDGRIYAIGCTPSHGYIEDAPKPWAEVYNPITNSWTDLPEPPIEILKDGWIDGHAVINNGNKILVSMYNGGGFTYDVKGMVWEKVALKPLLERGSWYGRGAVVDDVMYSYYHGKVYGYDLSMNKWLESPVLHLENIVAAAVTPDPLTPGYASPCFNAPKVTNTLHPDAVPSGFVVNIGKKKLGLLWCSYSSGAGQRKVYCITFTPSKYCNAEGKIVVTGAADYMDYYRQYTQFIVEGQLFDDCFAM
ncbi:F-box/kelch-repeat protein SKIP6 [Thalictrum thalictroides]|uniref:F-box/kelch-repeat protein SKIP6 n=1 Tax=Thalictrum thalictroides TaxID=46969 RepID=A0A7J6VP75_THATH|nr:F-box/kelch-repeat protein SKIP6 [Thalictrum thalictroides]